MSQRTLVRLVGFLLLGGVLALAAFFLITREDVSLPILGPERELEVTTVDRLDSLAAEGVPVSVTGTVIEQAGDGSPLLLDDGTGLIYVDLPSASRGLTGHRLSVRGPLVDRDGLVVLEPVEWLYDSTAVPVHSE